MSKQVFVSYSTQDTASAEQVRDGLETAGLTCWMAPRDIAPGLDYGTQIIDAIEACTVLVLVLSESSNYSIYVRKEVERAIAKGKVIIPVRIQEVAVSRSLEFFISDAQWIDAWDSLLSTAIIALHSAVSGHLANRGADVNAPVAPTSRPSLAAELLPSPTHSPSPTHQPAVERALFVGREAQMAELESALVQSLQGHGQLRFVTGEAGAGKSALLNEFQFRAREQESHLVIVSGACDAQTGTSDPYLPFREILTALAREDAGRAALLEHGPDLVDTLVPGTALGSHRSGPGRSPDAKPVEQSQIFEQTVKVVQSVAQRLPLVLILEDLHWVDDASNGLLFRLGRQLEGSRILLLGTYRSEEVSLGRDGEIHPLQKVVDELRRILGTVHVDLDAARESEGMSLVEALLDAEPNRLDAAFRQELYDHTGGHPLFVVELLRDLQSDGGLMRDTDGQWIVGPELNWSALPDRIEGIIGVRMDRLDAEERQLLTTASVMGGSFIAEVVSHALNLDSRHVATELSGGLQKQHKLVQTAGRERVGRQRLTHYRFSHNLMQVYLYEQLDEVERGFLHEDIGHALEALYEEDVDAITTQLARHFQAADLPEQAITYLLKAGQQAAGLSAHTEAIGHITKALALLAELPQTTESLQRTYSAHVLMGQVFVAAKGQGSSETEAAYKEALATARELNDDRKQLQTLQALARNSLMRGELDVARHYGVEGERLAESAQDPELHKQVMQFQRMIAHASGRHADAVAFAERVINYYRERQPSLGLDDSGELARLLSQSALSLVPAGYPDRALHQAQEGLDLAIELDHTYSRGLCMAMIAYVHMLRGEWPATLRSAQAVMAFCAKHEIPQMMTLSRIFQGLAMVRLGEVDEGIEMVHSGIAEREAMGISFGNQTNLVRLAEACGLAGRVQEGLELVNNALPHIASDRQYEPKYHQIQGDLLLMQDLPPQQMTAACQEAEGCFRRAIETAQKGGAKLWEARAMASLCQLLQKQCRVGEWEQRLGELRELYAWFTEGFETDDLRVVKEVLDV